MSHDGSGTTPPRVEPPSPRTCSPTDTNEARLYDDRREQPTGRAAKWSAGY